MSLIEALFWSVVMIIGSVIIMVWFFKEVTDE